VQSVDISVDKFNFLKFWLNT